MSLIAKLAIAISDIREDETLTPEQKVEAEKEAREDFREKESKQNAEQERQIRQQVEEYLDWDSLQTSDADPGL